MADVERRLADAYATAGGFLRAAQTDFTLPAQVQVFADVLGERWPYEQYARA